MSGDFEALGGETVYHGRIVDVRIEQFRHADGEVVTREIVRHRGAVAVVAHDDERVWLVRQPREAVGDRNRAAHEANLYDIDAKYGDVVSVDDVVEHLEELAAAHAPPDEIDA